MYDFYVDARTGQTLGSRQFRLNQTVRVVVHDINPFLYEYRLTVDRARIAEASPVDFFNAALGLKLPATSSGEKFVEIRPTCTVSKAAGRFVDTLVTNNRALRDQNVAINTKIESLREAAATIDDSVQRGLRLVLDATQDARTVHERAVVIEGSLRTLDSMYLDSGSVIDSLSRDFEANVGSFGALRQKGIADFPDCSDLKNVAAEMERKLVNDTLYHRAARDQIRASQDRTAAMRAVFEPAATDPLRFYQTYTLATRREPTNVDVTVARRSRARIPPSVIARLRDPGEKTARDSTPSDQSSSGSTQPGAPFDTIAQHQLVFGGDSHFTAAAGLVWGQIAERDYQTFVETRDVGGGFTDTITTVGYEKDTPGQAATMLTLNTRVMNLERRSWRVDGVHLVLGVGVAPTLPTEPKFLVGGALSFLDERAFLNGGVMIGRTKRLADGFSIDSRLPRGISSVPTVERVVARPALALTFRFAPW